MLSRKHYKAIAEIMKRATNEYKDNQPIDYVLTGIKKRLANYFTTDNPRFNRDKFMAACDIS